MSKEAMPDKIWVHESGDWWSEEDKWNPATIYVKASTCSALQAENTALRSTLTQQEQEIAQLKAEVERLTEDKGRIRGLVRDLTTALENRNRDLAQVTASRDEWKRKADNMQTDRDEWKAACGDAVHFQQKANAELYALRSSLSAAEEENKRLKAKCDNWRETVRSIRQMANEPAPDIKRIILWCSDSLSGFVESVETTMVKLSDERNAAESRATAAEERARVAEAELNRVLDSRLEGYRELGRRAANAENAADALRAELEETRRSRRGEHDTKRKEVTSMEALQSLLIAEISKQLKESKMNVQLLDVLNRLLGTVSTNLLASK